MERNRILCLEHAGGEFQGTFSFSWRSLFPDLMVLVLSQILFLDLVVLIPLLIPILSSRLSGVLCKHIFESGTVPS